MIEKTLALIKPDGVERGLIGEILKIYENKGLRIAKMKMINATRKIASLHYEEHKDKPFFKELVDYITEDRLVALMIQGENAVEVVRKVNGNKNPLEAEGASIRGKYAIDNTRNLVHGSDSMEHAEREIKIWFHEE